MRWRKRQRELVLARANVRDHCCLVSVSIAKGRREPSRSLCSIRKTHWPSSGFHVKVLKKGPSGYANRNSMEFAVRVPTPIAEKLPPNVSVQCATYLLRRVTETNQHDRFIAGRLTDVKHVQLQELMVQDPSGDKGVLDFRSADPSGEQPFSLQPGDQVVVEASR